MRTTGAICANIRNHNEVDGDKRQVFIDHTGATDQPLSRHMYQSMGT
jgi:hypothetical protein